MKRFSLLIFFFSSFLLLGSCAKEKYILPDLAQAQKKNGLESCSDVFPKGQWQFVHSIDFTMQDGSGTTVVGVTSLTENEINCALVTVEGLNLFQAVFYHDGSISVEKAIPPFNRSGFAEGMQQDIQTIFRPPTGDMQIGEVTDTDFTCRFTKNNGRVTDVMPNVDDCWQIKRYTLAKLLDRSVVGQSCRKNQSSIIPDYLELQNHGKTGYILKMTLLRAEYIQ